MILCGIENVDRGENGIGDDAILDNPNWKDFDVNDRSHWAYVGLSDEQFEVKKKVLSRLKRILESGVDFDMMYIMATWSYGNGVHDRARFFEVYENEDEYERPCDFIGYLAINCDHSVFIGEPDRYDRAMVLAKDVEGWEMDKIQALLTNKMLSRVYKTEFTDEDYWFIDKHNEYGIAPFDGAVADAITASADNDFVICSAEWNATKLSAVEKDALDRC